MMKNLLSHFESLNPLFNLGIFSKIKLIRTKYTYICHVLCLYCKTDRSAHLVTMLQTTGAAFIKCCSCYFWVFSIYFAFYVLKVRRVTSLFIIKEIIVSY